MIKNKELFKGLRIYCTGKFASYNKAKLQTIVESLGGEYAKGYAKSLDLLVVGKLKGSSKSSKALTDGIEVIDEDAFLKMIGED